MGERDVFVRLKNSGVWTIALNADQLDAVDLWLYSKFNPSRNLGRIIQVNINWLPFWQASLHTNS